MRHSATTPIYDRVKAVRLLQKTFHFDSDELDRVHEEPPTEAHDRTSLTDSIQNFDAVVVRLL